LLLLQVLQADACHVTLSCCWALCCVWLMCNVNPLLLGGMSLAWCY